MNRFCKLSCDKLLLVSRNVQWTAAGMSQVRRASDMVGFIGLGQMGKNMASHLQKKGHKMVVYDISKEAVKPFEAAGALVAKSPAHLAEQCNRVFTMVPTNDHVLEVYGGKDGIVQGAKEGSILMDSSTVDPDVSRTVHAMAKKKGVHFLDTPVAGAVPAARAGTLCFMVGGDKQIVDQVTDLLLCMGRKVVHVGDVGMGEVAKICNNMLLAISMIGVAETLNLGERSGVDPKVLTEIINVSSGRCWSSEIYNPVPGIMENVPAANDYQGGFSTMLITKDLNLATSISSKSTSPIPMGSLAHTVYRFMKNNGYGHKDFSVVYKFLKEEEGKKI